MIVSFKSPIFLYLRSTSFVTWAELISNIVVSSILRTCAIRYIHISQPKWNQNKSQVLPSQKSSIAFQFISKNDYLICRNCLWIKKIEKRGSTSFNTLWTKKIKKRGFTSLKHLNDVHMRKYIFHYLFDNNGQKVIHHSNFSIRSESILMISFSPLN